MKWKLRFATRCKKKHTFIHHLRIFPVVQGNPLLIYLLCIAEIIHVTATAFLYCMLTATFVCFFIIHSLLRCAKCQKWFQRIKWKRTRLVFECWCFFKFTRVSFKNKKLLCRKKYLIYSTIGKNLVTVGRKICLLIEETSSRSSWLW